ETITISQTVPNSSSTGPLDAGDYYFVATYDPGANPNYVGGDSPPEPFFVLQATPQIVTTPSGDGSVVGSSTSDTATVSGGYGDLTDGTVTFKLYAPGVDPSTGTPIFTDSGEALNAMGVATSKSTTTTAVGTYHWVATYSGDANNMSVSSGPTDEPVTPIKATPQIVTTPSGDGSVVGSSTSDTATVSGGYGDLTDGTVTFKLYSPGVAPSTGTPVFPAIGTLLKAMGVATSKTPTPTTVGS